MTDQMTFYFNFKNFAASQTNRNIYKGLKKTSDKLTMKNFLKNKKLQRLHKDSKLVLN